MVGFTNYGIVFSNILVGIRERRIFVESKDKKWYMIGADYRLPSVIIIYTVDFWIVDISRKYT